MRRESRLRRTVAAVVAVALIAGVLAIVAAGVVSGQETASGQDPTDCPVTNMGTLGAGTERVLQAEGRWTTGDCDSRFRAGSDAHSYRFEVRTGGRIRIELSSAEVDGYVYLLSADGERIADNDDGGAGLDARVERDLEPGSYLIEATTLGGRGRGPADFTLTVGRVAGCEATLLGSLEPGVDLTASGSWTLDTCGSRVEVEHPAHNYLFNLPSAGRVRIDLTSESGDPVLYFSSVDLPTLRGGEVATDDDGGGDRNSRVERYLPAGNYFIEATTYLARDQQPLRSDFTLRVHLVDEAAQQTQDFRIKVEKVEIPDEVVAGDPVRVHYRVGNAGGGDLPGGGNVTFVYVVGRAGGGRRLVDVHTPVGGPEGGWPAGVSYHSDDAVASATSAPNSTLMPLEITFDTNGSAYLFVGIFTEDADENELGWHGVWNNLTVFSGSTFGPTEVSVDGTAYVVSAEADDDGEVTTAVATVSDPGADVDEATRAKATYAAGVHTQLLDGLFERPAVAALAADAEPVAAPRAVSVARPSSSSLLDAFGSRYADDVAASGLAEVAGAAEAINPQAIEELLLARAASASAEYAYLASTWESLADRVGNGGALEFDEAFALQSQLAYAESVLAPAVAAGSIVAAARDAVLGWNDRGVQAMASELAICIPGESALQGALEAAGADVEGLVAVDAELRAALPLWGQAADNALCSAADVEDETYRFLERLALDGSEDLLELLLPAEEPTEEDPAPQTYPLRVVARLGDDGRIEFGAELLSGPQILPDVRYLRADAPAGEWRETSDVELDDEVLGRVRARRLADGRVEMGFVAGGEVHLPDIRYLPADPSEGVWFRGGEIEVSAGSG